MVPPSGHLAARIRAAGLPDSVARIAVDGGEVVHPELEYRAQSVWSPSWTVVESSGSDGLVPLWTCETSTAFAREDGTFVEWDAEAPEPSRVHPDFVSLVRSLLTDLTPKRRNPARRRPR